MTPIETIYQPDVWGGPIISSSSPIWSVSHVP